MAEKEALEQATEGRETGRRWISPASIPKCRRAALVSTTGNHCQVWRAVRASAGFAPVPRPIPSSWSKYPLDRYSDADARILARQYFQLREALGEIVPKRCSRCPVSTAGPTFCTGACRQRLVQHRQSHQPREPWAAARPPIARAQQACSSANKAVAEGSEPAGHRPVRPRQPGDGQPTADPLCRQLLRVLFRRHVAHARQGPRLWARGRSRFRFAASGTSRRSWRCLRLPDRRSESTRCPGRGRHRTARSKRQIISRISSTPLLALGRGIWSSQQQAAGASGALPWPASRHRISRIDSYAG